MIKSEAVQRVWLAEYKVDFRKGHDGLLAEAYKLELAPLQGHLVIFVGRDKRKIKVQTSK